jgi:hypothetical protein
VLPGGRNSGQKAQKLKYSGRKKYFFGEKLERNFSGISGKIAVLIFENILVINIGPMTSTAEQKHTA